MNLKNPTLQVDKNNGLGVESSWVKLDPEKDRVKTVGASSGGQFPCTWVDSAPQLFSCSKTSADKTKRETNDGGERANRPVFTDFVCMVECYTSARTIRHNVGELIFSGWTVEWRARFDCDLFPSAVFMEDIITTGCFTFLTSK